MTSWLRLGAFAVFLAAVFAASFAAGSAVDPESGADEPAGGHGAAAEASEGGHGADSDGGESAAPVRGLAVASGGLRLELLQADLRAGRTAELAFRVVQARGEVLRRFDVEHEKRMHLIVVRRDGTGFQHLHPAMGSDGVWRQRVRLDAPGSHRIFADFTTGGRAETLAADVNVDGDADYRPLPAASESATTASGYDVARERDGDTLRFAISRGGVPVDVETYLGAGGHLVSLREGDLAYIHTHPAEDGEERRGAVAFETSFPSRGRYRLYLQFKDAGRVHTAEFTQTVQP